MTQLIVPVLMPSKFVATLHKNEYNFQLMYAVMKNLLVKPLRMFISFEVLFFSILTTEYLHNYTYNDTVWLNFQSLLLLPSRDQIS